MYTIALVNQKGGVGKSTTAVNLSAGLAKLGQRVLLIDLDPQAHATVALGLDPKKCPATIYSLLSGAAKARDVIRPINERLSIIPSTVNLAGGEAELTWQQNPHFILKNAMAEIGDADFDYCIVDSPPQLGFLNVNSLAWVKHVMIPVLCEFYALHGLSLLLDTVERVRAKLNPDLQVSGVIACQYNARRALTREVLADLEKNLPGKVLQTRIRVNVRLAEAPSHGMSVIDYAPDSNGAKDYLALAREVFERMTGQQAPAPIVAAVEPAPAVEIEPPPPGGWGPRWSEEPLEAEAQAVAAPEAAPERSAIDPLADIMVPEAETVVAPAPVVAEAPVETVVVAEAPAEIVAAVEVPPVAVVADLGPVAREGIMIEPTVLGLSAPSVEAEALPVVSDPYATDVDAEVSAPAAEAVAVSEPVVVAEAAPAAADPYATDMVAEAPVPEPIVAEVAAEPVVEEPAPVAEPVVAAADPYATDVPKAVPATSPEFVVPMPATPVKDLPNAMPKPEERPAMSGRYAIAGLRPIITARPAGSATPLPEKKKGLFGSGLFGKLLKRD
jgi:chromosome partitioning protein